MTAAAAIPTAIADVTASWLSDVTGWDVRDFTATDIGSGLGVSSAVYRLDLTTDDGPPSVVMKLKALDDNAAMRSVMLRMYAREVQFFRTLADQTPIRIPKSYYAAMNDDGSEAVIIMENMGGNRAIDQVEGITIEDARACIDALAAWHANWWNKVDGIAENGAALPLQNPIYPVMLPGLFAQGWEKLTNSENCQPPANMLPIGPKYGAAIPGLLERLFSGPITLLHGDFRGDNLMFSADGTPIVIDFQLGHIGSAAYDLAYFITQTLASDQAREHEAALIERWMDGLRSNGVSDEDLADMHEQYRRAALFCLVYPVVAAHGMDLTDERQAALVNVMMGNLSRAVDDHSLADLV